MVGEKFYHFARFKDGVNVLEQMYLFIRVFNLKHTVKIKMITYFFIDSPFQCIVVVPVLFQLSLSKERQQAGSLADLSRSLCPPGHEQTSPEHFINS